MADSLHINFRADDRSFYALIKKDIHRLCTEHGMSNAKVSNIDIIVSELTSNLQKHASGGNILLKTGINQDEKFIEIICVDDGPGISDIQRVLADGYSSVSTMGHGLGSIKRLSDYFDIFSLKGWGTILVSRIFSEPVRLYKKPGVKFSGLNVPKAGEKVSGDGFAFKETEQGFKLMIADGLGHGQDAHEAVQTAINFFSSTDIESPTEMIRLMHAAIKKTRGCVATVVTYHKEAEEWHYAGVGNILLKWLGDETKTYPSYNGIVGHNIPGSMNDSVLPAKDYPLLIACSDGIKSNWNLAKFPQVLRNDGTIIATSIFKEFTRNTDDASVVVCKL